ncbi:hypothetical protein RRG08_021075 [Elysia crispata]|uniref:Uncharacterized protein n=1 Tax=Elysia crispata TaxID=231223 RepID=A0AAE1AJA7_9GAST|nr:hypothetical protein RRG08_021075 [Elysia crispata]
MVKTRCNWSGGNKMVLERSRRQSKIGIERSRPDGIGTVKRRWNWSILTIKKEGSVVLRVEVSLLFTLRRRFNPSLCYTIHDVPSVALLVCIGLYQMELPMLLLCRNGYLCCVKALPPPCFSRRNVAVTLKSYLSTAPTDGLPPPAQDFSAYLRPIDLLHSP